jgi:hypothetical protein
MAKRKEERIDRNQGKTKQQKQNKEKQNDKRHTKEK